MKPASFHFSRRRGFTLIELLVVIAIICLLLAILMPALWRVREMGRQVVCAANSATIMKAVGLYSTENGGATVGPNWGYPPHRSDKGWLYTNGRMDSERDISTGLLWPFIETGKNYRCPADDVDVDALPWRPYNSRAVTSYCMNGSPCRYGRQPYSNGYWRTYRLDEFKADDVLFWECDEDLAKGGWWDGSNSPFQGVTKRHYGHTICGNADGHVDWMSVEQYYIESPRSGAIRSRLWNTPGTINGW